MGLLVSTYQLAKSFSGKDLFQGVSFGIEEKEKVALLGPNGVGKSTLMKIMAGILKPDSGELTFRKGVSIGYLEQSPHFEKNETLSSYLLSDHHHLAKAYELMAKLELGQFDENQLLIRLSGGWQKRVALAKALLKDPDLLLLDEPTNHLDVEGIKWLEDFINQSKIATLIITHDRLFLQRVCGKILDLDPRFPGHLLVVNEGYEKYLETKALVFQEQQIREQKLANTLRREKEWLARGAIARQTKQKARQDGAASLEDTVNKLKSLNQIKPIEVQFESAGKGPQKLIEAQGLGKKINDRWLFRNLNLVITPKTRLALMGVNGAGKSTLIKTLLGQSPYDEGLVKIADHLQISYFEQSRETLMPAKSILHNICPEGDYVDFRGQYVHVRSYLERFGFYKEKVDLPVARLSGGEQARLRLAQMMLKKCNMLVLDEPTNDLDIDSLNTLEETLKEFDGAILLVTHDRYFMDQVSQQILSFSPFPDSNGELITFAEYGQWEEWYELKQVQIKAATKKTEVSTVQSKEVKKLTFKEKFELENMEPTILKLEERITIIQKELEKPEIASDPEKVQSLYNELNTSQAQVDVLYERWTELEKRSK